VDKLSANPLAPSSGHTSTVQLSQPISVAHVSPPPEHPAPAPSPAVPGADASAVSVERDVVPPATQAPLSAGASLPQILPTPPVPPLPAPSATVSKVAAGTTSEGGLPIVPLSLLVRSNLSLCALHLGGTLPLPCSTHLCLNSFLSCFYLVASCFLLLASCFLLLASCFLSFVR